MPFRLSTHLVRLACLVFILSISVSTIFRLGGPRSESAFNAAVQYISGAKEIASETSVACASGLQKKMFEEHGLVGCLAAQQYGTYAELVFEVFRDTEEFQHVVAVYGTAKVVPVLLKAMTDPKTFRLIEVEYRFRNAFAAALGSITSGIRAGKESYDLGERVNEMLLASIRELIAKSSQIHKSARSLEPQEFAFLLLYGMDKEGGSFLDQFKVIAVDQVETLYGEHAVHLLSSLFTSGLRTAEDKYRFDRDNFSWLRDGGNAALDVALLTAPVMGRWVVRGGTSAKVTRAVKTTKVVKAAKVTGVALGATVVGYGVTHPWNSVWAVNSAGQKIAEFLNIPFAGLFGPILGWLLLLSALTMLLWPLAVPLYISFKLGGVALRATAWCFRTVIAIGAWLFPQKEPIKKRS